MPTLAPDFQEPEELKESYNLGAMPMEEKDLEHCDKLMSQRDHGDLLRPADRLLVYADLADQVPGLVAEVRRLNLQVRSLKEAKARDREALQDLLEVLTPFYFHGKALRNANLMNLAPLKEISKCGVSALVGGAFSSAIEAFEKWSEDKHYAEA